jgi:hypothetical protein
MRVEARAALREKRRLWRATEQARSQGCDVEALYDQLTAAEVEVEGSWGLFRSRDSQGLYVAEQRWQDTGRRVVRS